MRKTRLWICSRCRKIASRFRSETHKSCPWCGAVMKAARKWPPKEWFDRRRKVQDRERAKKERISKFWSVPRDSHKKVLPITPQVRKAWRYCQQAKQFPTLLKRAQEFVKVLHEQSIHGKGIQGMVHPPEVVSVDHDPYQHGEYKIALFKGIYHISLNRGWPIARVKETILHESLHHVDAEARVPRTLESHGKEWEARLASLKSRIGSYATRYTEVDC